MSKPLQFHMYFYFENTDFYLLQNAKLLDSFRVQKSSVRSYIMQSTKAI